MRKILFLLAMSFFLGCGRPSPTTLDVVMSLTESEWQVMRQEIFPQFEADNDCVVRAYQVESADWVRKLQSMARAGKVTVDVFSQDNMRLYPLVAKGLVEDLTPYQSDIPAAIGPAMRDIGRFQGQTYFFPYRPNVQIVYYNESRFAEYGLNPPRTWAALLEVAKTFHVREGVGRIGLKLWGGSPTAAQVYEMIVSAGGDPFAFNDPGCIKTFTFLQKIAPYVASDSNKAKWDTTNTYLANESFYLAQNWPFGVKIIVRDYGKETIKAYSGWQGPAREAHVIGGEVLGIPKGAPDKGLALKFIRYLESRSVQEILVARLGWPSVRDDAYAKVAAWQQPYFEAVQEALSHGVYRPNVLYWGDFERFVNEAVLRVMVKGHDIQTVADEYHNRMRAVIQKYHENAI
jgi:trehalose transport system substrate-binding protein